MEQSERDVVSIYQANPNWYEKLVWGHVGPIFVVEHTMEVGTYTSEIGRRHRRYRTLNAANRRLEYEIRKQPQIKKAYLYSFPLDVAEIRRTGAK